MNVNTAQNTSWDGQVVGHAPIQPPGTTAETIRSPWWTARRAAIHVGAGPKEIYRAVRAGELKAVRLNRRGDIRILREWVDQWMEDKQRATAAVAAQLRRNLDRR
jgi:excisionase family DNA binding protein